MPLDTDVMHARVIHARVMHVRVTHAHIKHAFIKHALQLVEGHVLLGTAKRLLGPEQ